MKNIINKFLITRGIYPSSWKRSFESEDYHYYNGISATFKKSLPYLSGGHALDIGAGFGNETKELLGRGFEVVATDENTEAVKYLRKLSKKREGLTVLHQSLPELPKGKFDLILCEMVLHFLEEKEVYDSIRKMQNSTAKHGLNVVSSYINSKSIHEDPRMSGYFKYLLSSEELKKFYTGWETIYFEEKTNAMGHASVRMVAKKLKDWGGCCNFKVFML